MPTVSPAPFEVHPTDRHAAELEAAIHFANCTVDDALRNDIDAARRELRTRLPKTPVTISQIKTCGDNTSGLETSYAINIRQPFFFSVIGDTLSEAVSDAIAKATAPKAA